MKRVLALACTGHDFRRGGLQQRLDAYWDDVRLDRSHVVPRADCRTQRGAGDHRQ